MKNRKYWHELSKEEQEKFIQEEKITIGEFMKKFKQPDWCSYPNALEGLMGCWALVFGYIHSEEDCKDCEFYGRKDRNRK